MVTATASHIFRELVTMSPALITTLAIENRSDRTRTSLALGRERILDACTAEPPQSLVIPPGPITAASSAVSRA